MKNSIEKQGDRLLGLDVLRILSMILITLRHFIGYAEVAEVTPIFSANGIAVRFISVLCGSAVNIFVLISGFFLITSNSKSQKAIKIWGETFFYSVICFVIAVAAGLEKATSGKILLSLMPLITRHYWFTVAYLALYVLSPFLNRLLHALSQKEYFILVIGGAVILSAWTSVVYFSEGVLTGGNTGLLWFIYLYILGGFIRFYHHKLPRTTLCAIGAVGVILVLYIYSLLCEKIPFLNNFNLLADDSILELLLSVLLFICFLKLRLKSVILNKLIVFVGSCSFGVYLIQESCMIRGWLWHRLVKPEQYAEEWYLLPVAGVVVVSLFAAAIVGHKAFEFLFGLVEKMFKKK